MAGSAQTESESLCVKERDSPERQELEEKAEEEEEEKEDQTSSPAAPNTYTRDKTCDVTEVRAPVLHLHLRGVHMFLLVDGEAMFRRGRSRRSPAESLDACFVACHM